MKDNKENDIIEDNSKKTDKTGWEEQNKVDLYEWIKGNKPTDITKEYMFTYYELDGRERKEYEVEYILAHEGYIPCIRKNETNKDGQSVERIIQVGRLISPLQYDHYLLRKYELGIKNSKKNSNKNNDNVDNNLNSTENPANNQNAKNKKDISTM